jgi:hypothetical protein
VKDFGKAAVNKSGGVSVTCDVWKTREQKGKAYKHYTTSARKTHWRMT